MGCKAIVANFKGSRLSQPQQGGEAAMLCLGLVNVGGR